MSYSNISNKLFFIAIAVSIPFMVVNAQVENDSLPKQSKESFLPGTVKLSHSEDKISIEQNGATIYLPKMVKEFVKEAWTNVNIYDTSIIQEQIAQAEERKEMKALSGKLGFTVRSPKHLNLYREAADWMGTRYRWAGSSKKGVDCSGLTGILLRKVYEKDVSRSSHIIANEVNSLLNKDHLEPGDLVFFSTLRRKGISHVGVYLGEGNFIHASRRGVVVSNLHEDYYARTLKKVGRI